MHLAVLNWFVLQEAHLLFFVIKITEVILRANFMPAVFVENTSSPPILRRIRMLAVVIILQSKNWIFIVVEYERVESVHVIVPL